MGRGTKFQAETDHPEGRVVQSKSRFRTLDCAPEACRRSRSEGREGRGGKGMRPDMGMGWERRIGQNRRQDQAREAGTLGNEKSRLQQRLDGVGKDTTKREGQNAKTREEIAAIEKAEMNQA
eukprot:232214-Hanusia_phi.AAC.2